MITAQGLVKRYGRFIAVQGLDLHINRGEIYGLIGPNGAGKTSTIRMLTGISRPTEGIVSLFGSDRGPEDPEMRRAIGIVPERQPSGIWGWMNGYDLLEQAALIYGVEDRHRVIMSLLERLDALSFCDRNVKSYSKGMVQKIMIARALVHDPEILFLDEPISGLDPVGVRQVRNLILEERDAGKTICLSSHILSELERVCDRVAIICRGRVVIQAGTDLLMQSLAREVEIEIEIAGDPAVFESAVGALSFVREVVRDDSGRFTLRWDAQTGTSSGVDERRLELSRAIITAGLVPLSIRDRHPDLEDAFFTVTQESVDGIVAEVGEEDEGGVHV